jgi:CRISPR-associated protein Csm2
MANPFDPKKPEDKPKPVDPTANPQAIELRKNSIQKGINSATIDLCERYGKYLADKQIALSTSQLRNVFGEIRRIQSSDLYQNVAAILLLKPKLAYASARAANRGAAPGAKSFCGFISAAVDDLDVSRTEGLKDRFKNFCDLAEAILAYHKSFGGKD